MVRLVIKYNKMLDILDGVLCVFAVKFLQLFCMFEILHN